MIKKTLITGAYGVIGKAIAEMMAEKGYPLILVGRDAAKLKKVCDDIMQQTGRKDIVGIAVDLSREAAIKDLAAELKREEISILINNAGTTPQQRAETPEGIETQWATNVLGYMWMKLYLQPLMPEGSRIVNVASFYAGYLDINDVEFKQRHYDNDTAYQQSKQANRMLSAHFAKIFKPFGITVNSCHPGEISSKLSNNLGFYFPDPPRKGADTPVWVATAEELKNVTGQYFQYRKNLPCHFSKDELKNTELFNLCLGYTKFYKNNNL